jgi:Domain of unknown function (DUF5658)
MGNFAVKVDQQKRSNAPALRVLAGGRSVATTASIPTDVITLGLILAALQVLDGILTGIGVYHYGPGMEGNALLRGLMTCVGYIPALMLVKGGAIALIAMLCRQATKTSWLKPAFYGVIALYVVGAVIPWTYILVTDLLA